MILFHGTNATTETIDLSQSRVGKDFGIGFYLTPDRQVARRQAERKLEQFGEGQARVYQFFSTMMHCKRYTPFILKDTPLIGPDLS